MIVGVGLLGILCFELSLERSLDQASAQVTILPGTDELPETSFQTVPPPPNVPPNFTTSSIIQNLSYAHFVPLTNSPGNQVKLILNYSTDDLSVVQQPANAIMDVLSANGSLIKGTSFPSPFVLNQTGSIQLATTLSGEVTFTNVTAVAEFTDPEKVTKISNPVEINLKLGQIIQN